MLVALDRNQHFRATLIRPTFDVPQLLDPLAQIALPGWTRLCGWLSQPDVAAPLDPSG